MSKDVSAAIVDLLDSAQKEPAPANCHQCGSATRAGVIDFSFEDRTWKIPVAICPLCERLGVTTPGTLGVAA